MPSKVKWFIGISTLLIVLFCAGIYANYRLDQVVSSLNRPGVLFSEAQSGSGDNGLDNGVNGGAGGGTWNKSWGDGSGSGEVNPADNVKLPVQDVSQPGNTVTTDPAKPNEIASGVQQQINKPIEKIDLLKAGIIIMRKLSWEETQYLYQSGSKDSHSVDELKETRRILLDKLTPEDVQTLRELGAKYGKTLNILDPNVPIK
jgi:hypothetical protein